MYGSQIYSNTWKSFMDMENEMIKEAKKGKNRKNNHKENFNYIYIK